MYDSEFLIPKKEEGRGRKRIWRDKEGDRGNRRMNLVILRFVSLITNHDTGKRFS